MLEILYKAKGSGELDLKARHFLINKIQKIEETR